MLFAVEPSGVLSQAALDLVCDLGQRHYQMTDEPRRRVPTAEAVHCYPERECDGSSEDC